MKLNLKVCGVFRIIRLKIIIYFEKYVPPIVFACFKLIA